jgi:hypothetical protein
MIRADAHHVIRDSHRYCDERSIHSIKSHQSEPEFVDLDEAAQRMNMTKAQVMHLVRIRALRCLPIPGAAPLVEPAILTGAVPMKGKK